MRYLGPKEKKERRIGEKLFLKGDRCAGPKCAAVRRNYPPGFHGPKRHRALSEYGRQLKEKQKARYIYGLSERQIKRYFKEALYKKKDIGTELFVMLETRLDNVVRTIGFADSITQARQIVSHGRVNVNDRKATIPSMQVKPGDSISLSKKVKGKEGKKFNPPAWISLDKQKLEAKILSRPQIEDFSKNIEPQLLVELYSR